MKDIIKKVLKEEMSKLELSQDKQITVELLEDAVRSLTEASRYIESAIQYSDQLDFDGDLTDHLMKIKRDIVYGMSPGLIPKDSCNIVGRIHDVINQNKYTDYNKLSGKK